MLKYILWICKHIVQTIKEELWTPVKDQYIIVKIESSGSPILVTYSFADNYISSYNLI